MQDFPKLLPPEAKVGFTCFDFRQLCFAPCKNNLTDAAAKSSEGLEPDSASTAEHNSYFVQCRYLSTVGVDVETFSVAPEFAGIKVAPHPHVALMPHFAVTRGELRERFLAGKCRVAAGATLVLDGDIHVEHLDLEGTLIVRAVPGAKVLVKRLTVRNAGWRFEPLTGKAPEYLAIRGYRVKRLGQKVLYYPNPGEYVVEE